MTEVGAPISGTLLPVTEVPDPVFAQSIVGPGVAIDPVREVTDAIAPVSGKIIKLHPHAYVILTGSGQGVLVHLGIDTVKLEGAGFELLAAEGADVAAGDPIVRWDPAVAVATGMSPVVPIVVLDAPAGSLDLGDASGFVTVGTPLFAL